MYFEYILEDNKGHVITEKLSFFQAISLLFQRRIQIALTIKRAREIKHKKGSKVVVRSNENEPYWIGEVVIEDALPTKSITPFPMVKNDKGECFITMGKIKKYSPELCKILDKLTPKEQWNVLAENYILKEE